MFEFLRKTVDWITGERPPASESMAFSVLLGDLEVGSLTLQNGTWTFRYAEPFRQQQAVKPIIDFPSVEKEYRSDQLWPFFLLRIPSTDQPSVQRFIHEHSLKDLNEASLLRHFGRRSVANPFELVPA
jgi:HipA-like protein